MEVNVKLVDVQQLKFISCHMEGWLMFLVQSLGPTREEMLLSSVIYTIHLLSYSFKKAFATPKTNTFTINYSPINFLKAFVDKSTFEKSLIFLCSIHPIFSATPATKKFLEMILPSLVCVSTCSTTEFTVSLLS